MLFFGQISNNLNKNKMSNYEILKSKIINVNNSLMEISKGQLLANDDDGWFEVVDINRLGIKLIDLSNSSIDSFDKDYIESYFSILGKEPQLNDVLSWHSSNGIDKYSHFEVSKGEAYFSIYEGEETESIVWDLSKQYLKDQSPELLEWLSTLG
jgi:hypothetical protein